MTHRCTLVDETGRKLCNTNRQSGSTMEGPIAIKGRCLLASIRRITANVGIHTLIVKDSRSREPKIWSRRITVRRPM